MKNLINILIVFIMSLIGFNSYSQNSVSNSEPSTNPEYQRLCNYKIGTSIKTKTFIQMESISKEIIETYTIKSITKDMIKKDLEQIITILGPNKKTTVNTHTFEIPFYYVPLKPVGTMPSYPKMISQKIIDKGEEDIPVANISYHCNWTVQETIWERVNNVIVNIKEKTWTSPSDVPFSQVLKRETTNIIDNKLICYIKYEVLELNIPK